MPVLPSIVRDFFQKFLLWNSPDQVYYFLTSDLKELCRCRLIMGFQSEISVNTSWKDADAVSEPYGVVPEGVSFRPVMAYAEAGAGDTISRIGFLVSGGSVVFPFGEVSAVQYPVFMRGVNMADVILEYPDELQIYFVAGGHGAAQVYVIGDVVPSGKARRSGVYDEYLPF